MAQPKGQIALTEYELILLPSCAAMFALQHRNKSACIYIVKCDNVENLKIWISVLQVHYLSKFGQVCAALFLHLLVFRLTVSS